METKINIADIPKDKPVGLKLYSNTFGYISFNGVHKDKVYFFSEDTNAHSVKPNGKMHDGGECIIFPSKEMRDWEKFSWKKGDVLVNSRGLKILFDRWANGNYTSFYAKTINLVEDGFLDTNLHTLASEMEAKSFIKCIEEKLGGKLNRETSEIEKPQPEFKDGDIVYMGNAWNEYIGIIKNRTSGNQIETYAHCHKDSKEEAVSGLWLNKNDSDELRLATNSEKQQLFEALAKEGKAWDAEKKQIVDLKPRYEFKPMDWCLMRDIRGEECSAWSLCQFAYQLESGRYEAVGGMCFDECIPYNESTKHLLGTTEEWKGGEG